MSDSENKRANMDDEEASSSKRLKIVEEDHDPKINDLYTKSTFISKLSDSFIEKKDHVFDTDTLITNEPFTCCVLPNFIQSEEFVDLLKEDINELDVNSLNSDLYQFKQSDDFKSFDTSPIQALKNFFHGELLKWMKEITKIELEDKIDISCSCYTYTDHLLCHDDELEGRRIAYIYYLVPEWAESDGGTLDLFNSLDGQPTDICKSFLPSCNKFIFFEVGEQSFHQVAEVLAFKTRTSISGWFYGPPIKRSSKLEEVVNFKLPLAVFVDFKQWINPTYLDCTTQSEIQESFVESSEIELVSFLQEDKYKELCETFNGEEIYWMKKGPANKRNFNQALEDSLPPILQEFSNMLKSQNFLFFLSNLTGLKLHPMAMADQMGKITSAFRKWNSGCYSLLHSQSFVEQATLVASLHFNCEDWDPDCGGFTSFVERDEKDELLRVDPKVNSLALVYITPDTGSFVKYINCKSKDQCFHDIFAMYREDE